jgi:hypothetical protein
VYTQEEVLLARVFIEKGYRHRLKLVGSKVFKDKVRKSLKLVKIAGYYDFLRTYIRTIREINGFAQLRESEASIWSNFYTVEDEVNAACFFIQKASQMKYYIEGKMYYGHIGETNAINDRLKFLKTLTKKIREPRIICKCENILRYWNDSKYL